MKIVVDLPKEIYEFLQNNDTGSVVDNAIKNGTPLPEHHGDLVDKYDILHDIDCDEEMRLGENAVWVCEVIRNAPTIIEATEIDT